MRVRQSPRAVLLVSRIATAGPGSVAGPFDVIETRKRLPGSIPAARRCASLAGARTMTTSCAIPTQIDTAPAYCWGARLFVSRR